MKKLIIILTFLISLTSFVPIAKVSAQQLDACNDNNVDTPCNVLDPVCNTNPTAAVCQENQKNQSPEDNSIYGSNGIINKATNIIALISGTAAVIVIMIAGFQYIMSGGDPTKVNNAKNMILYAIIGLIVIVAARALILFVLKGIS